ncbi:hypothetical protein HPB47_000967, partial [Ixodes persulcatus]
MKTPFRNIGTSPPRDGKTGGDQPSERRRDFRQRPYRSRIDSEPAEGMLRDFGEPSHLFESSSEVAPLVASERGKCSWSQNT